MSRNALLWILVLSAGFLLAQQPVQPGGAAEKSIHAATRLVVTDVVVTDTSGNPVTGLSQNEFRIYERGKQQTIASFEYHPGSTAPPTQAAPLPPDTFTNGAQHAQLSSVPVILLIDALNTPFEKQGLVKKDILTFLSAHKTYPNIAVYGLGESLHLLQDFNSNPEVLRKAVGGFYATPVSNGPKNEEDSSMAALLVKASGPEVPRNVIENLRRWEAEQGSLTMDRRIQFTVEALRQIARDTAHIPQTKHLVWISGSFPVTLTYDLPEQFESDRSYADYLRETMAMLSDARITVDPVDANRLVGSAMVDASTNGRSTWGGRVSEGTGDPGGTKPGTVPKGTEFANELSRQERPLIELQATMQQIAEFTGGRVFSNRNDLVDALTESAAGFPPYYSIAYYPSSTGWDGKFRKIEVKLARGHDYKLRYRRGYFAVGAPPLPKQDKADQLRAAITQASWRGTISFTASLMRPQAEKEPVKIKFTVDPDSIHFLTQNDGRQYDMEFVVAAFKPNGDLLKYEARNSAGTFDPPLFDRIRKWGFAVLVPIELPAGEYRLRLVVRDNQRRQLGSLDAPLTFQTGSLTSN